LKNSGNELILSQSITKTRKMYSFLLR